MRRRCDPAVGLTLLWLAPAVALAQEGAPANRPSVPDSVGTITSLGIGLLVVIGLIFVCAWLVRRMSGLTGMNNQLMKVVSVLNLGARERIALIEVGDKQILVGITPTTIRTLHVFEEPVTDPNATTSSDFARRLQGMISKPWQGDKPSGDSQ
ncbi:MAG: flagellar biosynthetic protein FliO [Marinobacter sp.]|uniref:flagellar biosynthetic protein FliO n=1 Tax=Marinobacter sp. TaxID=50741 RepID=UPI00299D64A4|nr:flagellar biosynthetic protein FliO [Marinobacter sp.]MDX1757571.1 flagellar biosynthetic protein FliO [Marinobacter sp.]